jgi:hypothetical protein
MTRHCLRILAFIACLLGGSLFVWGQQAEATKETRELITEFHAALVAERDRIGAWPKSVKDFTPKTEEILKQLKAQGTVTGLCYDDGSRGGQRGEFGRFEDMEVVLGAKRAPLMHFHSESMNPAGTLLADGDFIVLAYSFRYFCEESNIEANSPPEHRLTLLVRDEQNKPLPGAVVIVEGCQVGETKICRKEVKADTRGEAVIYVGPERSPNLTVKVTSAAHYAPKTALPVDQRAAKKVFTMRRCPKLIFKALGPDGKPISNISGEVILEKSDKAGSLQRESFKADISVTDGLWTLWNIPLDAGDVMLKLRAPGFIPADFFIEHGDATEPDLVDARKLLDGTAVLTLRAIGKCLLTVENEDGGKIEEFSCAYSRSRGESSGGFGYPEYSKAKDGVHALPLPVTGPSAVLISADGYFAHVLSLENGSGQVTRRIVLKRAAPWRVVVLDAKRQPAAGVKFYARAEQNGFSWPQIPFKNESEADGSFMIHSPFPKGEGATLRLEARRDNRYGTAEWPCQPDKTLKADVVIFLNK